VIDGLGPSDRPAQYSRKPANSHELVLSRLQDLTQLIAERQSLSAILTDRVGMPAYKLRLQPLHSAAKERVRRKCAHACGAEQSRRPKRISWK